MRKIIAIQINTTPVRYVRSVSRRPGDQLYAEFTDNQNEAQDFDTVAYANTVIKRLVNPHERVFKATSISVTQPNRIRSEEEDMA